MISTYFRSLRRLGPTILAALVMLTCSLVGSRHAHAALTGPGATVAFGSFRSNDAALTQTTTNQTITITNTGPLTITIGPTDVVFSNADFSLVSPALPTTITAGNSRTFTVKFDPSSNGAIAGTMTITDNIPAESVVVNLSGTGTTAVLDTAPLTVDFALVNVGTTSSVRNATMTRKAGATGPLTVSEVSLTGGAAASFQIVLTGGMSCPTDLQHCTYTTGPGLDIAGGKTVGLRCNPAANATTTELTTTLNIVSDSDPTAVDTIAVKCTPARADMALNVASLDFAGVQVATTSMLTVMVTNSGNIPLNITITKTGTNPGDFAVPTTLVVNGGQTMPLNVNFTPATRGARTANVRLATNDNNNLIVLIPVAGAGQAPVISVTPPSINFGNAIVGAASGATDVVVSNVGEMTLNITSASIVAGGSDFTISEAPTVVGLNNGESLTWKVVCNPTVSGARNGTLRFVSNSVPNTPVNVPLSCNGQVASISLTPASSTYANRFVGATDVKTYTITNTGDLALNNIALDFAAATTEFTITTAPAPTLAVNASTTAVVRFNPQSAGLKSTTLVLESMQAATALTPRNATVSGQALDFTVTNTGTPLLPTEKRFDDAAANGSLVITNISAVPITLASTAFAPSGMTVAGDFVVNAADAGTVALNAGQTKTVRITLPTVLDRIGATGVTGTVTVAANNAGVRTQTFDVAIRSTTAMFALSTDTDFGTFDLDANRDEAKTLSITNTAAADAVLDLTNVTVLPFALQPLTGDLTLTPVTLQATLAPGAEQQLVVRFKPTRSQPLAAFDKMIVRVAVKGAFMMPANVDFVVKGRAIDRLLQNIATPVFPPTFTYPGDLASVRTIIVENLGEADLTFNALLVNASAAWTMDNDGSATTVPGFSSVPINVTFSPFDTNKQIATLKISHNDNTGFENNPMALYAKSIPLEAQGRNRRVVFSTGEIVFDPSPSGIPVLLSANSNQELATLINQEDAASGNMFRISKIEVVGDSAFSVVDGAVDQMLAPSMSAGIDLQFSPPKPGEYRATLKVYFDGAPVATSSVAVVATAVDTKLLGGGGCQSTNQSSAGALLLLAMLGLVARRRSNRRVGFLVARTSALCLTGLAAIMSQVATSHADVSQSKNLELSVFRATPSNAPQFLHTEAANASKRGDWSMQVVVSHATDPLIGQVNDGLMRTTALVSRRSTFELGAAYSFLSRYEAAVRLPLYVQDGADSSLRGLTGVSGTAMGDVSLHLKATLVDRSNLALAGSVMMTLPTAKDDQLAGVDLPSGLLRALATYHSGSITIGGNAGVWLRGRTQFASVQGSELSFAVGGAYRVNRDLSAVVDGFGGKSLVSGSTAADATLVALAGVRYHALANVDVTAALGRGLMNGPGSPSALATVSVGYVSRPSYVERKRLPVVIGDRDGDSVRDDADKCVNVAEDKDMFEDDDGCPDQDNDKDLIDDNIDKCPLAAEDLDSYEDSDGCPELDNDGDGVQDRMDKCPNEAEDKDGFADSDGCPEKDNDNDGIDDDADKCPAAAEIINGNNDQDGCPDAGDPAAVMGSDRIELLESITFNGTALTRNSTSVLGQVAGMLRAHREIKRLRVIVHVNERNAKDNELTQKRADTIREWLVQWGIAATRLEARGFGSSKMLVLPSSKNAQAINERVEFVVMEHE